MVKRVSTIPLFHKNFIIDNFNETNNCQKCKGEKKGTILKTILRNGSHGSLFHSKQVIRSLRGFPFFHDRAREHNGQSIHVDLSVAHCSRGTRSGWLEYIIEWESESEMKAKQKCFSDRNGK